MKTLNSIYILVSAGLVWGVSAAEDSMLKTEIDKMSYAIGMVYGRQMANLQVETPNYPQVAAGIKAVISSDKAEPNDRQLLDNLIAFDNSITRGAFAAGVKAASSGRKAELNDEQLRQILEAFHREMTAKWEKRSRLDQSERSSEITAERAQQKRRNQEWQNELAERNKKAGEAFLAENKKKAGIVTNSSGLQYRVLTVGTGPKPTRNDTVIVRYRGMLIDGTEFDTSFKRGEQGEFAITNVIDGWVEALLIMPTGSKWQLFIPPDLANTAASRRPDGLVFAVGEYNPATGQKEVTGRLTPVNANDIFYGLLPEWKVPTKSTLLFELELIGIKH